MTNQSPSLHEDSHWRDTEAQVSTTPLLSDVQKQPTPSPPTHHPPCGCHPQSLSSLQCPPSIPADEWKLFLMEIRQATALTKGQKCIAIAVGLCIPFGGLIIKGVAIWALWRYLAMRNVRKGLVGSTPTRKSESAGDVVELWNKRWAGKGVKVALKRRAKGEREGEGRRWGRKGRVEFVVEELEKALDKVGGGGESEAECEYGVEWEEVKGEK